MFSKHFPLFVKQDLDGFFGLAIDNLIQLLLIVILCVDVCGFPPGLVFGKILPAAALSVLFGNIYYSWQAHQLAKKTGRADICALPYGINTVSLFGFVFFVILPVYKQTGDSLLAWRVGVLACFINAVIETVLSFFGAWVRRVTPRAALLSALAGIAITFIAMDFAFRIFANPLLAFIPLFIILMTYFAKKRLPFGIPGGFYAVVIGSAIAWFGGFMDASKVHEAAGELGLFLPSSAIADLWQVLKPPYLYSYLSIIIPMALFNVIGSLQNIESAEAAGDSYPTRNCLIANGVGSVVASFLGSPFPTTIYIGHPGWKGLGARAGYSVLNGIFITLICFLGAVRLVLAVMPLEAGVAIVLWIGIVIMAQAYQATPKQHAPAVALGLIPALAAWGLMLVQGTLSEVGSTLTAIGDQNFIQTYSVKGIVALNQGFIFTSMIWAAISVFLIEHQFHKAVTWALSAAVLSFFGVIHTYTLAGNDVLTHYGWAVGIPYAVGYVGGAVLFLAARFSRP
ncbi:MAG: NCS2 family permease [Deltaproteobacteria bacterium]|nr:NCS2 family permease [Deltaproteobacteria bacterium]